jgi:long-chain fatty acid transport protein
MGLVMLDFVPRLRFPGALRLFATTALPAMVMAAAPAHATDGYFSHGYGAQSKGLAGAGLAYPKDSLALATNPAAATALGNRADVGVDLFVATRRASFRGTPLDRSYDGDGKQAALIPEAGWVRQLNDKVAVGIVAYGNGGMITNYKDNPFARYGATGTAGVELQQLFISPTVAYRVAEGHSVGLSVNLAGQMFRARGIAPFAAFSQAPADFSDRGNDTALGYGLRLGYLGQVNERLSLGAFWQSKTNFEEFDKYKGLFAEGGDFDAPSTYGVGVAFKATPKLDLVADWRRIEFSEIASVGTPLERLFTPRPFGADDGPGFGWRDSDVIKVGANYRIDDQWQVRAGYEHAENPVPRSQTLLNILAPGVVTDHYTIGATWTRPSGVEISGYALYAPKNTVRGSGSIPAPLGGGEADLSMGETSIGLSVGWKY